MVGYYLKFVTSEIVSECSHDHTMASNSNLLVLYLFSWIFKNLEPNDIVTQEQSGNSRSKAAHSPL